MMARRIEPGLIVQIGCVDHQRVAFPVAQRIAHPEIDIGKMLCAVQIDMADGVRELRKYGELFGILHYLKRIGNVHDAGYAGQEALAQRVTQMCDSHLLPRQCRGQIRDLARDPGPAGSCRFRPEPARCH